MWKKFANSGLSIPLRSSKILIFITIINSLAAFLSLGFLCAQALGYILLLPFLLIYAYHVLYHECMRLSSRAIIHCESVSTRYWRLTSRAGKSFLVKKLGVVYRTPWLVIVLFQKIANNEKITLVLPKDAMSPSEYRQLIAILWGS